MPFSNPIAGGTALARNALNSPDFQAGEQGWSINRDGSAEFSSATLRGEIDVGPASPSPRTVITKNIPATLAAGSADFTWSSVKLMYFDATAYVWEAIGTFVGTGGPFPAYGRGSYDSVNGVVYHEFLEGPGAPVSLQLLLYGSDTYDVGKPLTWSYRNGQMFLTSTTALVVQGTAQATAITADVSGVAETWHGFAFLNGFGNRGAGFCPGAYRKVASPANSVDIKGQIVSGATVASGTIITNLPAGYRPISEQTFVIQNNNTFATMLLTVETTGDVKLFGTWAAGNVIQINGNVALDL